MKHLCLVLAVLFNSSCIGTVTVIDPLVPKSVLITPGINTIRIAVIDTGFDMRYIRQVKVCKDGHKDFTNTSLQDTNGHGTNVAGLISIHAANEDYCLIFMKVFADGVKQPVSTTVAAFDAARELKVDIINYSASGEWSYKTEEFATRKVLKAGIVLVVAAGNEHKNLDKKCDTYPACYDGRVVVVGNKYIGQPAPSSNYGSVIDVWEMGTNVKSINGRMTGTSQATAVTSGKLVKEVIKRRKGWGSKILDQYQQKRPGDARN
jgi:hypothetical protein